MKSKIVILLLLLLTAFYPGCVQESALSDVELNDPSVICPEISFSRSKIDGSLSQSVVAWIYDKNSNPIEIKNGGVSLNGKAMPVKKLFGLPCYSGLDIISDIRPGFTYNVVVKLNAEKSYNASIRIQEKDLITLVMPLKHNKLTDMNISWTEIDPNRQLKLEMLNSYKKDNQESSEVISFYLPAVSLASGKYTIPSSYFRNTPNVFRSRITLTSLIQGTIYEGFMPGSKIESEISISSNCDIY